MPIGGLKEKLLAAQRIGVQKVLIPRENEVDLRDVPEETRQLLQIIPVDHMDQVVPHVLNAAEQAVGGTAEQVQRSS
jgi:ATP-dependent Lon protease